MNIFLLGSNGYIGSRFYAHIRQRGIPYLIDSDIISRKNPLQSYYNLLNFCKEKSVTFILNAAGYTGRPNVDACENEKEETMRGNVHLPLLLSKVSEELRIPWGHVSSGCLWGFTGEGGGAIYSEQDEPHALFGKEGPFSYYSATKALAEELITDTSFRLNNLNCIGVGGNIFRTCYVWRLRIPFDNISDDKNYLTKLMRYDKLLSATNSVSHRDDFVKACLDLFEKKAPYGIYNVVNTGSVTTELVVEQIKDILKLDKQFCFFKNEREFYEIAAKAARSNCVLDNSKLRKHVEIRTATDAIRDSLENWQNG